MIPRLLSSATAYTFAFILMAAAVQGEDTIVMGFGGDAQTDVTPYATTANETIKLIEASSGKAGTTNGPAIRDALNSVTDVQNITGSRIAFADANRIALRDVMSIRPEKGAKTLVGMLRQEPAEVPAP